MTFQASNPRSPTSNPIQYNGLITPHWRVDEIEPRPLTLGAPPHTPEAVALRFIEAEENFRSGRWNSAVAMYRSSLDIATKGITGVPPGVTFFRRLEWLHQNHLITPAMRDWADHVRVDGNEALHEPEQFTEAEAKPLRFFTEMFLRYIFELPGEVEAYSAEVEPTPEDAAAS